MTCFHFPATITNDPARKGELAADKVVFGKRNRYAVAPVHSRFDTVGWFTWDAETPSDDYDPVLGWSPAIIRIANTLAEATAGLA